MNREMRTACPRRCSQHAFEISRSDDATDHGATRVRPITDQQGLDGQTFAALGAACVDHGTATTGLHANEEAMGTGAASLGCLVSAFHDGSFLNGLTGSSRRAKLFLKRQRHRHHSDDCSALAMQMHREPCNFKEDIWHRNLRSAQAPVARSGNPRLHQRLESKSKPGAIAAKFAARRSRG